MKETKRLREGKNRESTNQVPAYTTRLPMNKASIMYTETETGTLVRGCRVSMGASGLAP